MNNKLPNSGENELFKIIKANTYDLMNEIESIKSRMGKEILKALDVYQNNTTRLFEDYYKEQEHKEN